MVRDKIKQITILYYSKPEIQEAIFNFSQNREIAPSFNMEYFGKRPDSFQYKNDIYELVKKGATSFHCSQEIWQDPLKISTDMNEQQYNELRTGWDLLLDIDSKYLDYSKILAQLIIKTFKFHGLKNFGVKFSVTGDTPILIKNKGEISLVSISEAIDLIKKGRKLHVLSLDKKKKLKFSKVYDFLEHKDTIYEITHARNTIPIKATGHHSVFVWDQGEIIQKKVTELKKGNFLITYNSNKNLASQKEIKIINSFQLGKNQYSKKTFNKKIKVSKKLMRLIGYFLAEGHVTNTINQVGFTFNQNERKYIEDCKNLLSTITNKKVAIRYPNSGAIQILIHSKEWANFFDTFCGKKKNKHVPQFTFKSPKELFLELLRGYIRGDGYKKGKYGIVVKSVSKKLITEMIWLCKLNNISCNLSKEQNKPHKLPQGTDFKGSLVYMLSIPKSELVFPEFNKKRNKFSPYPGDRTFPTDGLIRVYKQIKPGMFNSHRSEQMILTKKRANLNRIKKVLNWFHNFNKIDPDKESIKIMHNYESLFNSDVSVVEINKINKKGNKVVYDISVENTESFFGGHYPILLHNSGSKGFHIIVPWKAFPKEINTVKTSDKFPEWPRIITQYLMETTKKELIDRISDLKKPNKYIKDFEAPKAVVPDLILVSSRHLFRMPYSLHEKTALASVVLTEKELNDFEPKHAEPMQIKPREFSPNTKEGEAKELLVQALDWYKGQHVEEEPKIRSNFKPIKLTNLSEKNFSPSIQKILQGIKDGKKRALFILINFFRSIGMERAEIEQRIDEWNKKNEIQLKQGYIKSQLVWTYRNKIILPPNFNKDFYKGIGIIPTPEEIRSKNPTSYFIRKSLVEQNKEKHIKKNISKNKDNFKNKN